MSLCLQRASVWSYTAVVYFAFALFIGECSAQSAPGQSSGFPSSESVVEWAKYYYQRPEPHRIAAAIATFADDQRVAANKQRTEPIIHFFATLLNEQRGQIGNVEKLSREGPEWKRRFVLEVLIKARPYAAAVPTDPSGLDLIWSEFFATGDELRLQRVLSVLDQTPERIDLQAPFWQQTEIRTQERALYLLQGTAMWSLSTNAKYHARVKSFLEQQQNASKNPVRRQQIAEMLEGKMTLAPPSASR